LTARGLLRYIHSTTVCPTCQCKIEKEAAYNCSECQNQYHVRCLSTTSYPIQAQNPIWTPLCFICSLASPGDDGGSPAQHKDCLSGSRPLALSPRPGRRACNSIILT
jgi:hypothetical protein